ncbi:hypothetical protein LTR29_007214 [Friedmanniomyces endolithicus]|nr:hypothetical protein LTR29_007214 [Friedmanniomyces endolithicus]
MPTKHSASLMAAMARGEMWALHTVRSTEVMGSPVTPSAAAHQQQEQQQQQRRRQPQSQQQPQQVGEGSDAETQSGMDKAERMDK